jgi:hypothetical protein
MNLDRPKLKNIMREIYNEAQNLEVWFSLNDWDTRISYLQETSLQNST